MSVAQSQELPVSQQILVHCQTYCRARCLMHCIAMLKKRMPSSKARYVHPCQLLTTCDLYVSPYPGTSRTTGSASCLTYNRWCLDSAAPLDRPLVPPKLHPCHPLAAQHRSKLKRASVAQCSTQYSTRQHGRATHKPAYFANTRQHTQQCGHTSSPSIPKCCH